MAHLPAMQSAPRSTKSAAGAEQTRTIRSRLLAAMANPDLITIMIVCGIGILLTLNIMLRFSDFGASLQDLAQVLG